MVLFCQAPTHGDIGVVVLRHIGHLWEYLQIILLYGDILGFAIVLDPLHIRLMPDSGRLVGFVGLLDFWPCHEYTRTFGIFCHTILLVL